MKSKDQFQKVFKMYLAWAEMQTSLKMCALHSYRGGEYMAAQVKDILVERGIEHHLTMPGSPQSNGKAEQFNCIIEDKATAMLQTAGLSKGFWEFAWSATLHIYNRSPTCTLKWCTPFEIWYSGKVPDVSHLCIFRCKGYMHVPTDKCHKLDVKAIEVVFVGYEADAKGYRLWDKRTHSQRLSRDVTFNESSFPNLQSGVDISPTPPPPILPVAVPNPVAQSPIITILRAPSPTQSDSSEEVQSLIDPPAWPSTPPSIFPVAPQNSPQTPKKERTTPTLLPPRQSATHIKHEPLSPEPTVPGGFEDWAQWSSLLCEMDAVPRQSTQDHVPNPHFASNDNAVDSHGCWVRHAELLAATHVERDPISYSEVMRSADADQWREACQYEMDALAKNGTWELLDLPTGQQAVKSKWVFKLKADGRYCTRLVAKGFTQIPGIDFDETFSPVAHFELLHMLLVLATLEDWHIHSMDVKSVFLNGELDKEIYMEQPQGFIITGSESLVCYLKKAIYGLKQASWAWNSQLHGVLTGLGFK